MWNPHNRKHYYFDKLLIEDYLPLSTIISIKKIM